MKCKTLVLEDDIFKEMDIRRALQYCGIRDIQHVSSQGAGFEYIYKCEKENTPVELIVTDMHYPLLENGVSDVNAGFKLISRLQEEHLNIPVIICSSRNIKEPQVLGCVWYSLLRDLDHDFLEIIKKWKGAE